MRELLHLYKQWDFLGGLWLEDDKNRIPFGNTELCQARTEVLCRRVTKRFFYKRCETKERKCQPTHHLSCPTSTSGLSALRACVVLETTVTQVHWTKDQRRINRNFDFAHTLRSFYLVMHVKNTPLTNYKDPNVMSYWPRVRSRWLDATWPAARLKREIRDCSFIFL